jgi:hypothetical protein
MTSLSSGYLVSFDVGIKNLAYCLLDASGCPCAWDCLDLISEKIPTCHPPCKRKALYTSENGQSFCKQHGEKSLSCFLPMQHLCSLSKDELGGMLQGKGIVFEHMTKEERKKEVKKRMLKTIKKVPKASEISLIEVARKVTNRLDICLPKEEMTGLKMVLIENQISPIATRMKTLQGVLTEYFIIRFPHVAIQYVSSGNKLRDDSKEKKTYKENKALAVQRCKESLSNVFTENWLSFFENTVGKKDDLADCFLQGQWWLRKESTKQT